MLSIPCPDCGATLRLYSTDEAAAYLGISPAAVKYHVHQAGNLHPLLVGKTLLYTGAELDRFQANRRPAGRPKTQEEV